MIPSGLFPHTVDIVHAVFAVDAYHASTAGYGAGATTESGVRAFVQPVSQDELFTTQDTTVTRYRMITNHKDIRPQDHVIWDSKTFEVDGEPAVHSSPAGFHHVSALLRHVEG